MFAPPAIRPRSLQWLSSGALALVLTLTGGAHAGMNLPELSSGAAISMDPQQEFELGQEILSQVHATLPVIEDPLVSHYINSLGSRLVTATEDSLFPFSFLVVDDPQINAFATPGGIVVVHSGLIQAAEDESELAAVLAHEIAHVTQRHIARMYSEAGGQNFSAILGMVAAALLAAHSPAAAQASLYTGMAASADAQLQFSRDNEQEADRAGKEILKKAGYDTGAMNKFFKKLLDSSLVDADQTIEFLQTHPLPQSRISDSWQMTPSDSQSIRDSENFQYFKARISRLARRGNSQSPLNNANAARYAAALGLFQLRQPDAALQQLNLIEGTENRYTGLLRAQIKLLQHRDAESLSLLEALNRRFPSDPAIIQLTAEALIVQGKPEQAITLLRPYKLTDGAWLPLLPVRAQAESQSGRSLNSHESLASYYQLRGYMTLALEQLQLALQLAEPNSIAKARLEVQEKKLKERIRENRQES